MKISYPLVLVIVLALLGCTDSVQQAKKLELRTLELIHVCTEVVKKYESLDADRLNADHIYVDVFPDGEMLAFTKGKVGTFGKRSPNYQMLVACAVVGDKVVGLFDKHGLVVFGGREQLKFEDYSLTVYEYLYRIVGEGYKLLGAQLFDEGNFDKHNPLPSDYQYEWVQ